MFKCLIALTVFNLYLIDVLLKRYIVKASITKNHSGTIHFLQYTTVNNVQPIRKCVKNQTT